MFFLIILIGAHAQTQNKDEESKDTFYKHLELAYDRRPGHEIKTVLLDFNAIVFKRYIFAPTAKKFSLHEQIFDFGY